MTILMGVKETVLIYTFKNYTKHEMVWFTCVCMCGMSGERVQIKSFKSFM